MNTSSGAISRPGAQLFAAQRLGQRFAFSGVAVSCVVGNIGVDRSVGVAHENLPQVMCFGCAGRPDRPGPTAHQWAPEQSDGLLRQPGLELGVDVVAIIRPPLVVVEEGVLGVGRIGRHVRRHVDTQIGVLADQRCRRLAGRAVGDVFGLVRQTLRVGGELDEVLDAARRSSGRPVGMIQPSRSNTWRPRAS
jgi:hypothetical protein